MKRQPVVGQELPFVINMSDIDTNNTHILILMPSGRRGKVKHGTLVLDAARQLGVEIESICGGRQTCEKCRVLVEEGHFDKHGIISSEDHLSARTEVEIELLEKLGTPEQRLSCNARVLGDLLITVPEGSRAKKQIIRKSASERVIEVDSAIRQVYVEVDKAQLGMHRGDWGRLQDALAEQWNLKDLDIELQTLQHLQATLRKNDWKVTATIWNERQVIDLQPGYQEGAYGLAVDVGSTTVASYLCDLRTGERSSSPVSWSNTLTRQNVPLRVLLSMISNTSPFCTNSAISILL